MKSKKQQNNAKGKAKGKKGQGARGGGGGGTGPPKKGFGGKAKKGKGKNSKDPLYGQWNLVPIGDEYFADKEFENLVTFEELVDYDVVTKEDGTKEIMSGGAEINAKGQKRKAEEVDEDLDDDDVEDENESDNPDVDTSSAVNDASNVKQHNKKAKTKPQSTKTSEDVINTSAGRVIVEEDEDLGNNTKKQAKAKGKLQSKELANDGDVRKKKKVKKDEGKNGNKTVPIEDNLEENDDFEEHEWVKLGVPEIVLKALKEKQFNKPTFIQTLTLPAAVLGKKDIVGAAETGSGKTLAFAIPIINGILKNREKMAEDTEEAEAEESLKALILTPTRELAVQIKNHIDAAAKYAKIKAVVIVGGLASQKQERLLLSRPDIVIATPGRLWELIKEGNPHLSTVHQIRFLAVDETDRMVEKGHFQELQSILDALNKDESYKEQRQNFVFSATLAFTHEPPQRLKKIGNKQIKQQPKKLSPKDKLNQIMEMVGMRPNPKIVDITTTKGTCETLTEMQITCSKDHKDYYLYYFLLVHPGRTIVFCNSINCVRRLTNLFFFLQCGEVLPLHAEMHQKMRLRNLEKFTVNEKGILIATDVAARGLDIKNIQHVVHYQVPKTAESYIHRSGRTARAFQGGNAVLMIEPAELTTVKNIFCSLGRDEMLPNFEIDGKTFRELKTRVEMAAKVETFEHSVRKKLADHNWMEKAKKDMDLATSEEDSDDEGSSSKNQKKELLQAKKKLEAYKQQLSQMLSNDSVVLRQNLHSKTSLNNMNMNK